ncbi:hydrogenobyrinic acid a,c-diamide synthase (glutamine-hydrolyzing) [Cocleimonas sp. KMM 6892]|uniref:cobyrinate a,c-diamide synthase n=1 Tax=unclassified Cocleimonas TaxID=2639732 RepID=UPI002DBBC594|nr:MULTISPECIES: cobyrinate a,c-diamide synthase [unclassified Cocleimonas]MEB8433895.1 hydrogenobyrinic acid a,c-diamide synthase (glutamine-hydrolyzing) [Cocleimonas sp. KMM 6892]MEC4716706.1 hydrogenobyrinic acid a,c-diamide synthase (glutamine-hydrolyzing) [Cocleimonas sp. KMM 6895]MEC4746139.1 hydrogenobyrinic acid a,c-diamide synthase (glutamine-hydrolyzing) [Cocleimonas sp. KMM 6896]
MSRIYISAAHKSSGKTTISIGLCAALSKQGLKVQPFKKGPDYIDPLWLARASGLSSIAFKNRMESDDLVGCYNLDFNTQSKQEILDTLTLQSRNADISIIEGNKGLYDGVALDGSDSNAAVAKLTQSPVVLVIDSRGVTRGVAPLLAGYRLFDPDVNIAGVIFNLTGGPRHEEKLRAITETYTDIPILGMVRKNKAMALDERHLGLMPSNEDHQADQKISDIAQIVSDSVDLNKLIEIAQSAPKITPVTSISKKDVASKNRQSHYSKHAKVRIGICEDEAFGFYYIDDKKALMAAGAELVSINTLHDKSLPDDLDGLFIGGGFPETQMQKLSDNVSMRNSIHDAIEAGMPTYAECGGLMYLTRSLEWNGKKSDMVGVISADTVMHRKPQGRGYVELEETTKMPWGKINHDSALANLREVDSAGDEDSISNSLIKAHEFHYSRLVNISSHGEYAYNVHRGVGITGDKDGWIYKNLLANYSHLRNTDNFQWAKRFVNFVQEHVSTNRQDDNQDILNDLLGEGLKTVEKI